MKKIKRFFYGFLIIPIALFFMWNRISFSDLLDSFPIIETEDEEYIL